MKKLLAAIARSGVVATVWAGTRTVTLTIPSVHCALCPVTVKEALSKIPGVRKIKVSLAKRDAIVTFDDAKTTVAALTMATKNAGCPATIER